MPKTLLCLAALTLGATGCAHGSGLSREPAQLFAYHAGPESLSVSTYYAVGPRGVVVFDAPLDDADVKALSQEIRINTALKVEAVVVTSAQPERFAGAGELASLTGSELMATRSTRETIESSGAELVKDVQDRYAIEAPMITLDPASTLTTGETVTVAGVRLEPIAAGAGPVVGMSAIYLPRQRALIAGGLVFDGVHPRVCGGRSDVWIASLEALTELDVVTVLPGTGHTGGPELIQGDILYLRALQAAVTAQQPFEIPYNRGAEDAVVASMSEVYGHWALESALRASIADEWLRQGGFPAAFAGGPVEHEPIMLPGEPEPGEAPEESLAPLFGLEPPDEPIPAP